MKSVVNDDGQFAEDMMNTIRIKDMNGGKLCFRSSDFIFLWHVSHSLFINQLID